MKRVGILTSGGDCQGLNAAIRGVAKGLYQEFGKEVEIYGIKDGYKGLIFGEYKKMEERDFSGILTLGGTILGTSRQPFKTIRVIDENSVDKVKSMKENYKKMKLDCLVILGGNGTQKTANLLSQEGLNVIHLPKTIDNDIWGTDVTFGFHSAVEIATNVIDCIHTTATSHGRIFIVEVMGHKVGWLTLSAGIAGGADVILLPEIPYDIDKVAKYARSSPFWRWRKAPSPRRRRPSPRRSGKRPGRTSPIPPLCTALPRSWPGRLTTKSACASLGTSSGAAAPAPMTACCAPGWAPPLPGSSRKRPLA